MTKARNVTTLIVSLRKRTLPSPIRTLTPPGWNENSSSLLPALLPWATNGPVAVQAVGLVIGPVLVVGRAGDAVGRRRARPSASSGDSAGTPARRAQCRGSAGRLTPS